MKKSGIAKTDFLMVISPFDCSACKAWNCTHVHTAIAKPQSSYTWVNLCFN